MHEAVFHALLMLSVAQANLRHDTAWSKACSPDEIFVTKVLLQSLFSQAACSR